MAFPPPPLGGLSVRTFLREYWQKRPYLVRQAIPGFAGVLDRRALFTLSRNPDVESRLIVRSSGRDGWRVSPGPQTARGLAGLPARQWTLLVNDVNLHSSAADVLLQRFAFVPWSRLDDIMVSYAVDGGGVGPHADSYDVFLLQGPGRRRWRLMRPPADSAAFAFEPGAPLRLIRGFRADEEMILEPGDMLYLPPGWGHEGTALGTCHTYSIGFRAPAAQELAAGFLDYLHERGFGEAAYRDAGRAPASHPARIDASMIAFAQAALRGIRWQKADVVEFLGRHLSEPKQHVVFRSPGRPMRRATFERRLAAGVVVLDARSRLLVCGARCFLNGAKVVANARGRKALLELGDRRRIDGATLARGIGTELVYAWYLEGFLDLETRL